MVSIKWVLYRWLSNPIAAVKNEFRKWELNGSKKRKWLISHDNGYYIGFAIFNRWGNNGKVHPFHWKQQEKFWGYHLTNPKHKQLYKDMLAKEQEKFKLRWD